MSNFTFGMRRAAESALVAHFSLEIARWPHFYPSVWSLEEMQCVLIAKRRQGNLIARLSIALIFRFFLGF